MLRLAVRAVAEAAAADGDDLDEVIAAYLGRGDDTVGNPHRAQISQFEVFEFITLLKLDKQFSIEQSEAIVSQSTGPPPSRVLLIAMITNSYYY